MSKFQKQVEIAMLVCLVFFYLIFPQRSEAKGYISESKIEAHNIAIASWKPEISILVTPEDPNGKNGWYEQEIPCINLATKLGKSLAGIQVYYDFDNQNGFDKWKKYQGGCIEPPEGEHFFRAVAVNIKNEAWRSPIIEREFKLRLIERDRKIRPEAEDALLAYNSKETLSSIDKEKGDDDNQTPQKPKEENNFQQKEKDDDSLKNPNMQKELEKIEKEVAVKIEGKVLERELYEAEANQLVERLRVRGEKDQIESLDKLILNLSGIAIPEVIEKIEITAKEINIPSHIEMMSEDSLIIARIIWREKKIEKEYPIKLTGDIPLSEDLKLASIKIDQKMEKLRVRGLTRDLEKIGDSLEFNLDGMEKIKEEGKFDFRIEDLIREEKLPKEIEIVDVKKEAEIFSVEIQEKKSEKFKEKSETEEG